MAKQPRPETDEVELLFTSGLHGWSRLRLEVDEKHHVAAISHVFCEPLLLLTNWCEAVLRVEPAELRLPDEPGATLIASEPNRERQHLTEVRIIELRGHDDDAGAGQEIIRFQTRTALLVTLLLNQLAKVRDLGLVGDYAVKREPFPHPEFEQLLRTWKGSRFNPANGVRRSIPSSA